tara:strand:+ start:14256 stop:15056 length:801 start_codon:yes stop_codon:yes gene_type:complete
MWRKYNGALIPDIPPHLDMDIIDVEEKIKQEGAYFARWTSNFDQSQATQFWYVIQDRPLEIDDYKSKIRNQIRRSLKKCNVKKVGKDEIIQFGYNSYSSAFKNYNTFLSPLSEEDFVSSILSLGKDWEFWGIYNLDGLMIGYSQNRVVDDYCDYSIMKFHPDHLKSRPSEALIYTMNQHYLNERKFSYVNDGARSISHETNVQEFLIQKFKFRKAYCRLNIMYSWKVQLLLSIIYPLRSIIGYLNFGYFSRLNILIKQEKIRRSYE